MARDTYIIRPKAPVRPARQTLSREEIVHRLAVHVLRIVAVRIDSRH